MYIYIYIHTQTHKHTDTRIHMLCILVERRAASLPKRRELIASCTSSLRPDKLVA